MYYGFDKKFDLEKKLVSTLTSVFGIGRRRAEELCYKIGGCREVLVKDVGEDGIKKIVEIVGREEKNLVGIDLERELLRKARIELKVKSYKGMRKIFGLPVNGQKTKTNARTVKKNKKS